jgi:hypothetical protein
MKKRNLIESISLGVILMMSVVACRPGQKDPQLKYNHNRLDAKVQDLKIEADNPLAKIAAPEIWKKTTGKFQDGNRVRVAIVGTGIDYTIPDLRDAVWVNLSELSESTRSNEVDDDNNGYSDDVIGYDFASGDSLPYDWNGHDTFTASVIAATGRTNPDVVGVAPNAELLISRYIDGNGQGRGMDAVEALHYAIVNNSKVIYFNWPQGGFKLSDVPLILEQLADAGQKNILVVMPAGNNGNHAVPPFIQLAAKLPNVIAVAGLDKDGKITATSNSGRSLALTAAPMVGAVGYFQGGVVTKDLQSTSVAAAYVAGAAALIATLPQMGSVAKIRQALLSATPAAKTELLDVLSTGALYLGSL